MVESMLADLKRTTGLEGRLNGKIWDQARNRFPGCSDYVSQVQDELACWTFGWSDVWREVQDVPQESAAQFVVTATWAPRWSIFANI